MFFYDTNRFEIITRRLRTINPFSVILDILEWRVIKKIKKIKIDKRKFIKTNKFSPKLLISKTLKGLISFEQLIVKHLKVVMMSKALKVRKAK